MKDFIELKTKDGRRTLIATRTIDAVVEETSEDFVISLNSRFRYKDKFVTTYDELKAQLEGIPLVAKGGVPLGIRLLKLRLNKGLTEEQLAAYAGWSEAFVDRYEAGDTTYGWHKEDISTLSRIFNVPYNELIEGTDFTG
jgi:Helix-turn-helix